MFKVGINNHYLAIRKADDGIISKVETNSPKSAIINSKSLINKLIEAGWPVPSRLFCQVDSKNNMLVVKKPGKEE
jgi:hypothetical protein